MKYIFFLISSCLFLTMSSQAQNTIKTDDLILDLEIKIKNEKKYTKKVKHFYELATIQRNKGKFEDAQETYQSLLELVQSKNDTLNMGKTLFNILVTGGNESGMAYAELLESLYENKRNINYYYLGTAKMVKAFEFRQLQKNIKALENTFLAYDYFKKVDTAKTPDVKRKLLLVSEDIFQAYIDIKEFDKALKAIDRVIELIGNETTENSHILASVDIARADINLQLGDTTKGLEYLHKAYETFTKRKDTLNTCVMLMNIGNTQVDLKQHDKGLIRFNQSLDLLKKVNRLDLMTINYRFIGNAHMKMNRNAIAHKYIDSSLALAKAENNNYFKIAGSIVKAKVYENQEKNNLAISTLRSALKIHENTENYQEMLMDMNKHLSRLYSEKNDPSNSNKYLKKYIEKKENILAKKDDAKIHILEVEYNYSLAKNNLEKKEMAFQIAQIKEKQFNYILFFISSGVLLLFGLFIFNLLKRKKQEKMEYAIIKTRHQSLLIKKNTLDRELELKKINATDFSLQINEKINLLKKITNQLQEIKPFNAYSKEIILETMSFLNNEIEKNNNKPNLFLEIDKNNNDFKTKIEENFKNLSAKEKEVAIMVRIGKSSKQIAQKMDISIPTVDNYRYKLRKKMNIAKGESLKDFIKNI